MRKLVAGLGLAAALLPAGCNNWPHTRDNRPNARLPTEAPNAASLVGYLNANSQRVQGLRCLDVDMDVKQGVQSFGLTGMLACQKPKSFRLVAKVVSNPEADIGSNEQEFWYWIRRAEPTPYVFHCSYADYQRGNMRYMPFPFQPDWIMEAMGIAEYDPAKRYDVRVKDQTVELAETTTSPQGQRLRKVTVFNTARASAGRPQVMAHLLQDANGREICSAYISEVQMDQTTGAILPRRMHLIWAGEKNQDRAEMKLKLDGLRVGPIAPEQARDLFSRSALSHLPAFDLARGPDGQASPVQRVRGQMR